MMFVASFDERSESFDGSPQPLAEESIAKTSTLNNIALSYPARGARSPQCTQRSRGGTEEAGAGGGRPGGRRLAGGGLGGLTKRFREQPSRGGGCQRARCCSRREVRRRGSGSVSVAMGPAD